MKPLSLSIAGLNSFREPMAIDFNELCRGGVFGIFGPTGSGKSTVLDAITLALYGSVERVGKLNQGIVNDGEERLSVQFTFSLGDAGVCRTFRAHRIYEREKKDKKGKKPQKSDDSSIKFKKGQLVEINNGTESVLAEKSGDMSSKVAEILGLTIDDFTRAVVLPQGKFAEFLLLKGDDRKQMLERLFSLAEYGEKLNRKVKDMAGSTRNTLDRISSNQETLSISEEGVKKLEQDNSLAGEEKKKKEAVYNDIASRFEAAKLIWDKQRRLTELQMEATALRDRQPQMKSLENELEKARRAERVRKGIDEEKELESELEKSLGESERCERTLQASVSRKGLAEKCRAAAYEAKEREGPAVREKIVALKAALELEKEILEQQKKAEILRAELEKKMAAQKTLEYDMETFRKDRNRVDESLGELKKKREHHAVDPDHRKNMSDLLPLFNRCKGLEDELKKLRGGRSAWEREERKLKTSLDSLKHAVTGKETEIEAHEHALSELRSAPPAGDDQLDTLAVENEKRHSLIRDIGKAEKELASLSRKAEEQNRVKTSVENEIASLTEGRVKYSTLMTGLEQALAEIAVKRHEYEIHQAASRLAGDLREGDPCPVCGSLEHPAPARALETAGLTLLQEEMSRLEEEKKLTEAALRDLDVRKGSHENEQTNLEKNLHDTMGRIDEEQKEVRECREQLAEAERALGLEELGSLASVKDAQREELRNKAARHRKKCELEEKGLEKLRSELKVEAEKMSDLQGKHAAASGSLAETSRRIAEKEEELTGTRQELEKMRGHIDPGSIPGLYGEMLENDRQTSEIAGQIKKEEEKIPELQKLLEEKSAGLLKNGKDLAGMQVSHDELSKKIALDKEKLVSVTQGGDPRRLLKEAEERLRALEDAFVKAEKELKEADREHNEALIREAEARKAKESARQNLEKKRLDLSTTLEREGFTGAAEAIKALRDGPWMEKTAREITEYNDGLRLCEGKCLELSEEVEGSAIDEDAWRTLNTLRETAEADRDGAREKAVIALKTLEDARVRFGQWRELEETRKDEQKLYDNLLLLEKTLRGRAFVEFLAEEQMRMIALDASTHLGNLTGQRYALEIASDSSFVIRDNANGGFRRPVNTLSGGEIFITSLSLALSLSSHIQLKGKYMLEFFFLDEGFGSLDPDLLETVMNALEKLKMENFHIGIISHVPELRNRISRRLIVTGAEPGGRGSSIRLEIE